MNPAIKVSAIRGEPHHERGEIDVVGHPALLEVGAVAGNELGAGLNRGLRAVVERPLDVGAASGGGGRGIRPDVSGTSISVTRSRCAVVSTRAGSLLWSYP